MMKRCLILIFFLLLPLTTHAAYDLNFQKGYNLPSWWFDSYSQSWSDDSFKELLTHKPGWIAVGPFWYQKDHYATTIYANAQRTANDAGVEHVIQTAHANGVKVMLKPSVDAENGKWRGTFMPKDVNAWFASYTAMALHYADMAERLKVESYLIGAEYVTLSGPAYGEKWRGVATAVRGRYHGKIGYGANWDNQKGTPEFELVTWWDAVDFIGIHGYFPLSKTNSATLQDMMAGIAPWVARVEAVQTQYQKPVVFTEAGYKSCDGGTRIPWWCNPKAAVDLQEQSDGTEAVLRAFQDKAWFQGIFWWMWNIKPWHGGSTDKDHNLNRKPAMDVIKKYWNTVTPQAPTPLPPSPPPQNVPPENPPSPRGGPNEQPASSGTVDVRERDIVAPHAPTNFVVKESEGNLVLTWSDPSDDDLKRILVLRNSGGTTPVNGEPYAGVERGVQTFTDRRVEAGTTYQYIIRAEDASGNRDDNMSIAEGMVSKPPPIVAVAPPFPGAFTPFVPPTKPLPVMAAMPLPGSSVFSPSRPSVIIAPKLTPAKPRETKYGIPRMSLKKEREGEKRFWNAIKRSFGNRRPKLKKGEWTRAVNAYLYGGYPVDVIRDFLRHKKNVVVSPTVSWKELSKKR